MLHLRFLSVILPLAAAALLAGCESATTGSSSGSVPPPATTGPAATGGASPLPEPVSPSTEPTEGPDAVGAGGPLALESVADGLDDPVDLAVHPRDPAAVLVAEQTGAIRVVRDGKVLPDAFLDLGRIVTVGGEQGLLGVAPHPDPADDRVFVYYTDDDSRQVVSSFRLDPDGPDRALRRTEVVLLRMADKFGNHNGGSLAFGPDGYLYIGTGDGGGSGDPLGSGRDLDTLLAKVLRIDVDVAADADPPYEIPPDNPFADGEGGRPEIWATGMRNPWRMRFDPATGDLWIGDVGQHAWEEIDRIPTGVGGLDFGWNTMEGFECYEASSCDADGLTLPVVAYGRDDGCAVTGGAVYRGTTQASLIGRYVYADYCSGRFWSLDPTTDDPVEPVLAIDSGRNISAIAAGPEGELFATDHGSGELLRIVAAD